MNVQKEIKRLAKMIENEEQLSYGELLFLQSHKRAIYNTGDIRLCEWAGITEDEYNNGHIKR